MKPSFVDWTAINNKKGILFFRNRDIVSPCLICFISILFQTFLWNVHTNVLVLSCFLYIQTSEFECLFTLFHLSCPIYKFFLYLFLFKKLNRILYKGCFHSLWHIKHPHTNSLDYISHCLLEDIRNRIVSILLIWQLFTLYYLGIQIYSVTIAVK